MMPTYDLFGWYSGERFPARVASVAPDLLSESETDGDIRANWTGHEWIYIPYQRPEAIGIGLPSLADYDKALTSHIDSVAQSRRWADRISLMARAGFNGPWQAEAIAFGVWADSCNQMAYQMMLDYEAGNITPPTIADFIAALPAMDWPS